MRGDTYGTFIQTRAAGKTHKSVCLYRRFYRLSFFWIEAYRLIQHINLVSVKSPSKAHPSPGPMKIQPRTCGACPPAPTWAEFLEESRAEFFYLTTTRGFHRREFRSKRGRGDCKVDAAGFLQNLSRLEHMAEKPHAGASSSRHPSASPSRRRSARRDAPPSRSGAGRARS